MTTRAIFRSARPDDVEFLARIDLVVDEETGETYHHGWTEAQRAEHRGRIAVFVDSDDAMADVAVTDVGPGQDRRIAMLLARVRDLTQETEAPDRDTFLDVLWPTLPQNWLPTDGRFVEMFQLWVHPQHRRRGVASGLKRRLEARARQRDLRLIYTHTRASHDHVVALNERLGYRRLRTGPLWDDVPRTSLAKFLDG